MGSSNTAMARPAVSEPTGVQHTVHLHLSPEGVATLQVPELDLFLEQEGVSFSERATWDVLRFVYQLGGMPLVRETLQMIRERRARAEEATTAAGATAGPFEEPAPDYDVPYGTERPPRNSRVSPARKRRNDFQQLQRGRSVSSSSSSCSNNGSSSISMEGYEQVEERRTAREADNHHSSVPTSPTRLQPVVRDPRDHERESKKLGEDGWTGARSSMEPQVSDLPFGRPVSKMWKRPMAPEVHQDLVRALRERSRESLDASMVEADERPESERPGSLPALPDL